MDFFVASRKLSQDGFLILLKSAFNIPDSISEEAENGTEDEKTALEIRKAYINATR
jgi:hypothetical protein